ncbi:MAG TPA: hypothetical protein VI451_08920 [Anaerolineales bacterium]|nr:hypothetical protein [Anaerolineales bacterium]
MKAVINKRRRFVFLLLSLIGLWLVPVVFAAPIGEGVVPTITPTVTLTSAPPTAPPPPTNTPNPYPAALTQTEQALAENTQAANDPGANNAPDQTSNAAAAGSSVLGFLLCAGVIIVAGLAALNIWTRRRP